MPHPEAPVKTPLGQDELRHRTRGLGQRYRTILLLVDGRRPLGEVLGMAHQAGAQTSHFEELVRLGLVALPSGVAAPEPVETAPGALDTPRLTNVELDVLDEAALTPMGALLPEPEDEADFEIAEPPDTVPEPEPEPADAPLSHDDSGASASEVPAELAPLPVPASEPPQAPESEPAVTLSDMPRAPAWTQVRDTPFKVADHARAAPRMDEEQRLNHVRDLLLDTLQRDSLLFATFAVGRVRSALTQGDLIKLVWEIERDRGHARRNRHQLVNLQRARELLGMGNTHVAGESQSGPSSEY